MRSPSPVVKLLAVAAGGLALAMLFQVLSAIQYAVVDRQGLDPGPAPGWVMAGTYVGLVLLLLGATGAAAVALMRRR